MASPASKEALLAELDRVVRETLAYFEGAGRVTAARVDRWHARDVLMHFIYFHDATAWGLQSAALGGSPWPLPTDADGINEVCRRLREHESFDELLTQVRQAHARLGRAVQNAPYIDKPCFRSEADGINVVCRRLREHESFDELLTQVRQAHARLGRAVQNAPDIDKPCFRRTTGEFVTGRQRLEVLARHWAEHVRELQAAARA